MKEIATLENCHYCAFNLIEGEVVPDYPILAEVDSVNNTSGHAGVAEIFTWDETSRNGARIRTFEDELDLFDVSERGMTDVMQLVITSEGNFVNFKCGDDGLSTRIYGISDRNDLIADDFLFA